MTSRRRFAAVSPDWPLAEASHFLSVAGVDWHVQVSGSGPTVLCLHGAGASSHSFSGMSHLLSRGFRVVAPDLPGQGFTSLLPSEQVGLKTFAEKLAALMDALGARPDWIIGHSAGAALASQYALDYPDSPRGILSINGAFTPFGSAAAPLFSQAAKFLSKRQWLPRLLAAPSLRWRATGSMLADTGSSIDPQMSHCYDVLLGNPDHIAGTLRMMAGWELPPLLARLKDMAVPVWLCTCARDRTIPPSRALTVAGALRDCRIIQLPDLGHLGHEEKPAQFVEVFEELVRSACNP